ncbi:MAG: DNA (cytosine-5-)-methyltransferase [Casimicrobium sp.]
MKKLYKLSEVADLLSVSKETLRRWDASKKLPSVRQPGGNYRAYTADSLRKFETLSFLFDEPNAASNVVKPIRAFSVIELFAGAGGMAVGLESAGLKCRMLNEIDRDACATLRMNRPAWDVREGDIAEIDFNEFHGKIDVVTGGFPCQAFSYAGKKLGFEDTRGTLFFEFARAVKEIQPLICVGENVRGLLTHEGGRTLAGMISVLNELGYDVMPPRLMKALFHRVPQKRERLLIVGLRRDSKLAFEFPQPHSVQYNLRDALKAGELYSTDVPVSDGQKYPKRKREIMEMVPPGGYWRDLPLEVQKEYMKESFHLSGGKTGIARRISWDEPSLTLTCAPAQKQTERCHPEQTRPFTIREYARIQTFPDEWQFAGSQSSQYKQIGNAVPVNLAHDLGVSLVRCLNEYEIRKAGQQVIAKRAARLVAA